MHVTAKFVKLLFVVALVAVSSACGEFTREGRGPVVLVVDGLIVGDDEHGTLLSDVVTRNSTFNDMAEVEMRVILKDPGVPGVQRRPDPSQRCHDHAVSRRVTADRWSQHSGCGRPLFVRFSLDFHGSE